MRLTTLIPVLALLAVARANAQTVEVRIVERNGQTSIPINPGSTAITDNILNFSVQARVVGAGPGAGIRSIALDFIAPCERDSWGSLTRVLISNADGTYAPNFSNTVNNTVGLGGLAAQYCFTAASDPNANGLLNTSGGGHVNNPTSQDIALVQGLAQGSWLLRPLDADGDGNPDTSSFNGSGTPAPDGTTVTPDVGTMRSFFGADGSWVDVYRFKYTVSNVSCRNISFQVVVSQPPTLFSQVTKVNGAWQGVSLPVTPLSLSTGVVFVCDAVPFCGADHNHDLATNVQDIFDFIGDWFNGCTDGSQGGGCVCLPGVGSGCTVRVADFDCDGRLTITDLFAFINAWFGRCQ